VNNNLNFNLLSIDKYFEDPKKHVLLISPDRKFFIRQRLAGEQEQSIEDLKNVFQQALPPAQYSPATAEFRLWTWLEGRATKAGEVAQPIVGSILDKELEWQNFKSAVLRLPPHPVILIRYKSGKSLVAQLEWIRGHSIVFTPFDARGRQAEEAAKQNEIQSIVIVELAEKTVDRLSEEVRQKVAFDEIKRFLRCVPGQKEAFIPSGFFPAFEACFSYITLKLAQADLEQMIHDYIGRQNGVVSKEIEGLLLHLGKEGLLKKFRTETKELIFVYMARHFFGQTPREDITRLLEYALPDRNDTSRTNETLTQALTYYSICKIWQILSFERRKSISGWQAQGGEMVSKLCDNGRGHIQHESLRSLCLQLIENSFAAYERVARNDMLLRFYAAITKPEDFLSCLCQDFDTVPDLAPLIWPRITQERANILDSRGVSPLYSLFEAVGRLEEKEWKRGFSASSARLNYRSLFQRFYDCKGKLIVKAGEERLYEKIFPVVCRCFHLLGVPEMVTTILESGCSLKGVDRNLRNGLLYLLNCAGSFSTGSANVVLTLDIKACQLLKNNIYKKFYDQGIYTLVGPNKEGNLAVSLLQHLPWQKEQAACTTFMADFMHQFPRVIQQDPVNVAKMLARVPLEAQSTLCNAFLECVSEKGCRLHAVCKYAVYSKPLGQYLEVEKSKTGDINKLDSSGNSPWYYLFAAALESSGDSDSFFEACFQHGVAILSSKENLEKILEQNKEGVVREEKLLLHLAKNNILSTLPPANRELLFLYIKKYFGSGTHLQMSQILGAVLPSNCNLARASGEMLQALIYYRLCEIFDTFCLAKYESEIERRGACQGLLAKLCQELEGVGSPQVIEPIGFEIIQECFDDDEERARNQMLDRFASAFWKPEERLLMMCRLPYLIKEMPSWVLTYITSESANFLVEGVSPLYELFHSLGSSILNDKEWSDAFPRQSTADKIRMLLGQFHKCGGKLIVEKGKEKLYEEIFPTVCRCFSLPRVPQMVDSILESRCSLGAVDSYKNSGLVYLLKNTWKKEASLDVKHCEFIIKNMYQKFYDAGIYSIQTEQGTKNLVLYLFENLPWCEESATAAGESGAKEKSWQACHDLIVDFMKRFPKVVQEAPDDIVRAFDRARHERFRCSTSVLSARFLDAVSPSGYRLHTACKYAAYSIDIQEMLAKELEAGKDLNAIDHAGNSPGYYLLDCALSSGLDAKEVFHLWPKQDSIKIISKQASIENIFSKYSDKRGKEYFLHEMCKYAFIKECRDYILKNMNATSCNAFDDRGNAPLYYIFTYGLCVDWNKDSGFDFPEFYSRLQEQGARIITKDSERLARLLPKLCSNIEMPGIKDVVLTIIESGCSLNTKNPITAMEWLVARCGDDIELLNRVIDEWYLKFAKYDSTLLVYLFDKLLNPHPPSDDEPERLDIPPVFAGSPEKRYISLLKKVVEMYPGSVNIAGDTVCTSRVFPLARSHNILDIMIEGDLFEPRAMKISDAEYQDLLVYFFRHGKVSNPLRYIEKLYSLDKVDLAKKVVLALLDKKFPLSKAFETGERGPGLHFVPPTKTLLDYVVKILGKMRKAAEKRKTMDALVSYMEHAPLEYMPIDSIAKMISDEKGFDEGAKATLLDKLFFHIPHVDQLSVYAPAVWAHSLYDIPDLDDMVDNQVALIQVAMCGRLYSDDMENAEKMRATINKRLAFQLLRFATRERPKKGSIAALITKMRASSVQAGLNLLQLERPNWTPDIDTFRLTYLYKISPVHLKCPLEAYPAPPGDLVLDKFYDLLQDLSHTEVETISKYAASMGVYLWEDPVVKKSDASGDGPPRLPLRTGIRRRFEEDIYRIVNKHRRPVPGHNLIPDALPGDIDAYYAEVRHLRLCTLEQLRKKSRNADYHSLLVGAVKEYVVASEFCGARFLTTSVRVLQNVLSGKNLLQSNIEHALGDLRDDVLGEVALDIARSVDQNPSTQNPMNPHYYMGQSIHFYQNLIRRFGQQWNIPTASSYEKMKDPHNYLAEFIRLDPDAWMKKIESGFFARYTPLVIFETAKSWIGDASSQALTDLLKATMPADFKKAEFDERRAEMLSCIPDRKLSDKDFAEKRREDLTKCKQAAEELFRALGKYGCVVPYDAKAVGAIETFEAFDTYVGEQLKAAQNFPERQKMKNFFAQWLREHTTKGKLELDMGMPLTDAEFQDSEKIWAKVSASFEEERGQQYVTQMTKLVDGQGRLELNTEGLIHILEAMGVIEAVA
jgi:hypothetical protein